MTKQQIKSHAQRFGDLVDYWRKIISAGILFFGLLVSFWAQFLGPGIKSVTQDFLGITELAGRLGDLERNVPPPAVVEWNESMARQRGTCTSDRCVYTLNGARTRYGESCGAPQSIIPFLRSPTGQSTQISFDERRMTPVHLTRQPHGFLVWLNIPEYLGEGDYSWQAKIIYEGCPGRGEPIERATPWFPLRVTPQ